LARAINADAAAVLADHAAKRGALMVQISTDYVFDGRSSQPYLEDAPTQPLAVYGRTKLAGEEAVRQSGAAHLILRTSWVYGAHGGNFLRTMLKLMRERPELKIVNDQFGAPTWSDDIARTIGALLVQWREADQPAWRDTVHVSNAGRTNWHAYAQAIAREARARDAAFPKVQLHGIPASQYPTQAVRPANSVLDGTRLKACYGLALPAWESSLSQCMDQLMIIA
jgi:dTDP-4-dehydrorhamnose reductase